jgi:Seven in absentia protein family
MSSNSTDDDDSQVFSGGSKSSQKRPRPSEGFYDCYICVICYEYLTPPVIRCKKDHNYCFTCINRLELLSGGSKCPTCRHPIDKNNRNRFIEGQLEQLIVPCRWKIHGCTEKIPLSQREKHEKVCNDRPGGMKCYFNIDSIENRCYWAGKPTQIRNHLMEEHNFITIERDNLIRFLWDPPNENKIRIRPRLLQIKFPSENNPYSYFILEHLYIPEYKQALFAVRTLDPDLTLNYRIELIDRKGPENGLMFKSRTLSFDEFSLDAYPKLELNRVFQVSYDTIKSFTFINGDDHTEYFSFHVIFDIPVQE